jgi:hypothetical protein
MLRTKQPARMVMAGGIDRVEHHLHCLTTRKPCALALSDAIGAFARRVSCRRGRSTAIAYRVQLHARLGTIMWLG